MSIWFLLLASAAALGIAAVFYLITRVRRFSLLRRLAERSKALSWLAATAAVGLLFFLWLINVYAVVVAVLHLALIWMLCDLAARIVGRIRKKAPKRYYAGAAALMLAAVYLGAGWINAHHIRRTAYTVEANGAGPMRIVLISDSHLGVTLDGGKFAKELERIRAEKPNLVVLVGDFTDDDSKKADMLEACRALGTLKTTFGVFFVYGNHDNGYYRYRDYTGSDLRAALTENGVHILEDEAVPVGDRVTLIGRKDRSARDRMSAEALLATVDPGQYTVLLDHQPNDYDAEAAAGADLVLSGHTHGGHIFPAGWIGLWTGANDFVYGRTVRGNTAFIVTSGLSGWAIPFKTGAFSEYVVIDLK